MSSSWFSSDMSGSSRFWGRVMAACLVLAHGGPVEGQVLSPGKLSEAHANLEGVGECTQCHQLRKAGVDSERCLGCHEPLAAQIEAGAGYHARLPDPDCGACHKEHLGRDFALVHFDTVTFVHDSTGYNLEGRHGEAGCRSCHRPEWINSPVIKEFKGNAGALEQTFMGLGTECALCHANDDPHGGQFPGRACSSCHSEGGWNGANTFEHSRTRYPLQGAHRDVECERCHRAESDGAGGAIVQYQPVSFADCRSCHQDPHESAMAGRCDGCHETAGWERVPAKKVEEIFDHSTTEFPLDGAHADAACGACHDPERRNEGLHFAFRSGDADTRAYPRPLYDRCASCHTDPHEGSFPDQGCDACHGEVAWTPTRFGLDLHDRESEFALTGAHRVTPCDGCHVAGAAVIGVGVERVFRFRLEGSDDCRTCHSEDDPHEEAFPERAAAGRGGTEAECQLCHTTDSFQMDQFDHQRGEVQPWIEACSACHGKEQPHGNQFQGRECGECHETEDYRIPSFDHSGTQFPLDGAHAEVQCGECHEREAEPRAPGEGMVRYRPLDTECSACHGGGGEARPGPRAFVRSSAGWPSG